MLRASLRKRECFGGSVKPSQLEMWVMSDPYVGRSVVGNAAHVDFRPVAAEPRIPEGGSDVVVAGDDPGVEDRAPVYGRDGAQLVKQIVWFGEFGTAERLVVGRSHHAGQGLMAQV